MVHICCKSRQQICTGEAERVTEKKLKSFYLPSRRFYGFTSPSYPLSRTPQHPRQSKNCLHLRFHDVLVVLLVGLNHAVDDDQNINLFISASKIANHAKPCRRLNPTSIKYKDTYQTKKLSISLHLDIQHQLA